MPYSYNFLKDAICFIPHAVQKILLYLVLVVVRAELERSHCALVAPAAGMLLTALMLNSIVCCAVIGDERSRITHLLLYNARFGEAL